MKKKELKPVDHSTKTYLDIRKNLYIIPKALANVPDEQVTDKWFGGVGKVIVQSHDNLHLRAYWC